MRSPSSDQFQIHVELSALCFVAADREQFFWQVLRNIHEIVGHELFRGADALEADQRALSRCLSCGLKYSSMVTMGLMRTVRDHHLLVEFFDLVFDGRP